MYFEIVDKDWLKDKNALDLGCGTGRWMKYMSQYCGFVDGVDPSKAVFSASKMLEDIPNTRISQSDVDNLPFADESFDFVYSLGVLHHIPDTKAAMQSCVKKVKKGNGYFLVYLYYNLENRHFLLKVAYWFSNKLRMVVSRLPSRAKRVVCDVLAVNDCLDRFDTPLEQRFSRKQVEEMMLDCGLSDIKFSNRVPFWHAIGRREAD